MTRPCNDCRSAPAVIDGLCAECLHRRAEPRGELERRMCEGIMAALYGPKPAEQPAEREAA